MHGFLSGSYGAWPDKSQWRVGRCRAVAAALVAGIRNEARFILDSEWSCDGVWSNAPKPESWPTKVDCDRLGTVSRNA